MPLRLKLGKVELTPVWWNLRSTQVIGQFKEKAQVSIHGPLITKMVEKKCADSPHVLRCEEDKLSVRVILCVFQHQSHADATIHHVLRLPWNENRVHMYI